MMNIKDYEFWFVAGSQHLYGEEALQNVEKNTKEIAEYLKRNPGSKVTVTGYADKGTGNSTINKRISVKRAQAVADMLVNKYGISFSRIVTDSKGDTEQPFVGDKNRVSICIAE